MTDGATIAHTHTGRERHTERRGAGMQEGIHWLGETSGAHTHRHTDTHLGEMKQSRG